MTYLLSRTVVTGVRHRGLRSRAMLGIALILLIFALQDGQATAVMPFTAKVAVSTSQTSDQTYWEDFYRARRLHRTPAKKPVAVTPAVKIDPSLTLVARGVVLSSPVIQTVAGPEQVSMLDIDLTSPYVRLGVVQAYNRLISPDETVSSMANRTGAVAGINGDYFEIHSSGVPIGEEVINGQLLHSPNTFFPAVLGVTSSGRLTIGPESFSGSVIDGAANHTLYSVNHYSEVDNGRLLLFTPALGAPVYVGGDPVALIQHVAGSPDTFIVRSVKYGMTWLPALSGQDALLGSGYAGYWLANAIHQGDHIRVTAQISPDAHPFQAIGGGPMLLKDGAFYYGPNSPPFGEVYPRNPFTGIGVTKDGTHALLIVFDGRGSGPRRSRGMTYAEVARFMLAHGAYNAMLFDSGGSSEMVDRLPGQRAVSVTNWPSGGDERPVANGLFVYSIVDMHATSGLHQWWRIDSEHT